MKKAFLSFSMSSFVLLLLFAAASVAQPRPAEKPTVPPATTTAAAKKDAPVSLEARYEGGLFGYNEREKGTLNFDDLNERLVFFGENKKELFSIPYKAMLVVSPSAKKVQSGTGRTISAIPILGAGIAGGFLKKKKNYLVIQFRDPDVDAQGTTSFLIDTNELLETVVQTLGAKAEMKARGNAFYRPAEPKKADF